MYLLGTQPNVYLSVRKFDDASSPGQAAIGTMPLGDNAWHHVEVEFLIRNSLWQCPDLGGWCCRHQLYG